MGITGGVLGGRDTGFFVSTLSHTWNTQGAQSEICTRQIHRPAAYTTSWIVQVVQPPRTDERAPSTLHSLTEHNPREWV